MHTKKERITNLEEEEKEEVVQKMGYILLQLALGFHLELDE